MKNQTVLITLIFFSFLSLSLYSQSIQTIGIVDITAKEGISQGEASFVTDFLYNAIYNYVNNDYSIIARSVRDQVLAEQEFALSGLCSDTACALEIGKMLASDFMIFGTAGKFGTFYRLSLQMVDVNTSVIVGNTNQRSKTLDDFEFAIDAAVVELFGKEQIAKEAVTEEPVVEKKIEEQPEKKAVEEPLPEKETIVENQPPAKEEIIPIEPVTTPKYTYPKRGLGIVSITAGTAAVAGGFVTTMFSNNYSIDANTVLDLYNSTDPYTDFDQAWSDYETAYFNSKVYEYSSYGLWAGGAVLLGMGISMIFDKEETKDSMNVSVVPGVQGMLVKVNLT